MNLPRIIITMGDPAGIGPEVTAKALDDASLYKVCTPVVVGNYGFLKKYLKSKNRRFAFVEVPGSFGSGVRAGIVSKVAGRASYKYIVSAVDLIKSGEAGALVTAPISKQAMKLAGAPYTAHTELLAEITSVKEYCMMMAAGSLRAAMVTRHAALKDVSGMLTVKEIMKTSLVAAGYLRDGFGIKNARICVCALNPHAGDNGLSGREEISKIMPAVKMLCEKGIRAFGPVPADAAWMRMKKGEYDCLITMYHDQAMIGLKCSGPGKIVNITAGLPFVRTSPGHGTGFDIAGKGRADPGPMKEAIRTAAMLVGNLSKPGSRNSLSKSFFY